VRMMRPTKNSLKKLLKEYIRDDKGFEYIPISNIDEVEDLIMSSFTECGTIRETHNNSETIIVKKINKSSITEVTRIPFL